VDANGPSPSRLLLAWYDAHRRDLPWRAGPGTPADPYRVWLSEVMLQQTTVATVTPRFERFVARWPNIAALAAAPGEEVMAAWAGLGYYSRARNLVSAANMLALDGFPRSERGWRELPGVGSYTAAAIAAIANGERAVVIDTNVERIVARLLALDTPLPAARPAIRAETDRLTPDERAGDFAQGMMDLGATICTPRRPLCERCPLADMCRARATGAPEAYRVKAPRRARPARRGTAFWLSRGSEVRLVRREADAMLGGMRAPPDDGWTARRDGSGLPPVPADWRLAGTVRHVFTHVALTLDVMQAEAPNGSAMAGEWWPVDRLAEAGLPTLFTKAAKLARTPDG
jgi:A/G-specific adenine glycosylase